MMAGLAGALKQLKPGWLGIPQAVKPASFVNGFVCEVGQYRWIVNMMH
jgi:hypothetical protein